MDVVYNTMCLQAHQVQALKKNLGSYDGYDKVLVLNTGIPCIALQLVENKTDDRTIWLPSISQIVDILLQKYPYLFEIIEMFDDWCFEFYKEFPNRKDVSMIMLWMMFYMEQCHNMYWCWPCNNWKLKTYKTISNDNK